MNILSELKRLIFGPDIFPDRFDELEANLINLPTELLLLIIDFLDNADVACLAVCHSRLRDVVGVQRWNQLRLGGGLEEQRQSFLLRLTRDPIGHFFCYHCSHLHPTTRAGPPGLSFRSGSYCLQCISDQPSIFYTFRIYLSELAYSFVFTHLQLAMERHRYGSAYGISLESLCITEVKMSIIEGQQQTKTLLTVEPMIIINELYLRVQQWISFEQLNIVDLTKLDCLGICSHIQGWMDTLPELIQCKLAHDGKEKDCVTCSDILHCPKCSVDFRLEFRNFYDENVLIITKWLNLGNGLNPKDSKWQNHISASYLPPHQKPNREKHVHDILEPQMEKSYEVLTEENAWKITDPLFKYFARGGWFTSTDGRRHERYWRNTWE